MNTPLFLKDDENFVRPSATEYFLVAQNGVFFCRNNKFFQSDVRIWGEKHQLEPMGKFWSEWGRKEEEERRAEAVAKAKRIDILFPHEEEVKSLFPLVKTKQLQKVIGFFDWVYTRYHSESIVLLYWDLKSKRYHYYCPPQTVSSSDCHYPAVPSFTGQGVEVEEKLFGSSNVVVKLPPMCQLVGTIHSHCDMDTEHSYTDEKDEKYTDGVHAIVGRLRDEPPQFAVTLVVDGKRFSVSPTQFLEPYTARDADFPTSWIKQVKKDKAKVWSSWWDGSINKIGFIGNNAKVEEVIPVAKKHKKSKSSESPEEDFDAVGE